MVRQAKGTHSEIRMPNQKLKSILLGVTVSIIFEIHPLEWTPIV